MEKLPPMFLPSKSQVPPKYLPFFDRQAWEAKGRDERQAKSAPPARNKKKATISCIIGQLLLSLHHETADTNIRWLL